MSHRVIPNNLPVKIGDHYHPVNIWHTPDETVVVVPPPPPSTAPKTFSAITKSDLTEGQFVSGIDAYGWFKHNVLLDEMQSTYRADQIAARPSDGLIIASYSTSPYLRAYKIINGRIKLLNTSEYDLLSVEYSSNFKSVEGLSFSPSGTILAICVSGSPGLYLCFMSENKLTLYSNSILTAPLDTWSTTYPPTTVKWAPDSYRFAVMGHFDPWIDVYQYNGSAFQRYTDAPSSPLTTYPTDICWGKANTPDANVLLVTGGPDKITAYRAISNASDYHMEVDTTASFTPGTLTSRPTGLFLHYPSGNLIVANMLNIYTYTWADGIQITPATPSITRPSFGGNSVSRMCVSPNGEWIAFSNGTTIYMFKYVNGVDTWRSSTDAAIASEFNGLFTTVYGLQWISDEAFMVTGYDAPRLYVFKTHLTSQITPLGSVADITKDDIGKIGATSSYNVKARLGKAKANYAAGSMATMDVMFE